MVNQELLSYIQSVVDHQLDQEQITRELLTKGWSKEEITQAFQQATMTVSSQTEPVSKTLPFYQKSRFIFLVCGFLCILGIAGIFIVSQSVHKTVENHSIASPSPSSTTKPQPTSINSNTITIHIGGTTRPPGFIPPLLSVHLDDIIIFQNDATPAATYQIHAEDNTFNSAPIDPGQTWSVVMNQIGFHQYSDPTHPVEMVGAITVVPKTTPLLPTPNPQAVQDAIEQDKKALQDQNQNSATTSPTVTTGY